MAKIKGFTLILLLGICLLLSACGQKGTIEQSSEGTPAPLQWGDVYNPVDGTIDQDKYNELRGISVPEQDASEEVPANVVLLGALSADYQYISGKVNGFNQAQDDYNVKVQRYESMDAMFLDLVRGQGCDLLALSPTDLTVLADRKGLEDLAPYLEKSEKVSREDLFDAVVEAGTAGGKLAGILPGFTVEAILVEKGSTEDGGWTIEEYLALMDKYPDVPVSGNAQPEAFYIWLMYELSALPESFVNWDERTCSFDNEDFINTIEMLKKYVERCKEQDIDTDISRSRTIFADRLYKRQVQTLEVTVGYGQCFSDYQDIRDAFLDSFELAGWPSLDGKTRYPMTQSVIKNAGATVLYSMNAASSKKDAAWRFLEYMLSEYQETMAEKGNEGFPARRDIVERLLQEEAEAEVSDDYFVINRYTREPRPKRGSFTEEDKEQVLYILDHAVPPTVLQQMGTFYEIFVDELRAFIAGDKTAAEAARLLQNRISLYLSE